MTTLAAMPPDHAGDPAAAHFWDHPQVARALQQTVTELTATGVDATLAKALVYDALAQQARDRTAHAVVEARDQGRTWRDIAEAFNQATSTVRHRFDPTTIERRRASVARRRSDGRIKP